MIRASHPGPSIAITAMIVLLAATAQPRGQHLVVFALAALLGEFSIGWSNDAFDADRDAAAGRTDKPIPAGAIGRAAVFVAATGALVVSTVLAFLVTVPTGVIHLVMMAAGWAYNAGLKSTPASALTYAVGFGLIPVFAASTLPGSPLPKAWTAGAAALLGVGAHFVNVLPDLEGDRIGGVRGLPQRVAEWRAGPVTVRLIALALLVAASGLIVFGPGPPYTWPFLAGFGLTAVLALVGAAAPGRVPFLIAIAIAAIDVVLFAASHAALV
ncbi:MAG TPA: UbiA family prenyltransferase [Micromonosporaceae bacterium]|nr:UbiA family prenyltransferase [Micromonosporaceae bacterium]